MNEREKIIRLWFDMWIKKADLGIDNIFTDDVVYTESWSPTIHIEIVIFPYFEKKKQIGFERTINSSLTNRR